MAAWIGRHGSLPPRRWWLRLGVRPLGIVSIQFHILASDGRARLGRLETPHGEIETPAFMPVATLGAVKGIGPHELEAAGASIVLANLYHLSLRPGIDVIAGLGGLHAFTGWRGPLLTDSGGYQVFSLAARRQLDEEGVVFRSHLDGSRVRFTPESVVEMQEALGVDVAMVLDECPPWPVTREAAGVALERTIRWARRARGRWSQKSGGLFGILQGSVFPELRERAVEALVAMDFDGYAIGGVSVGEPREKVREVVAGVAAQLPVSKPRYLMGLGTPLDLLHGVEHGVDLFDCVLPARNARHGIVFTRRGILRIKNARFRDDPRPLDSQCECPACRRVSRALVHHLVRMGETTGGVLATLHNLRFYLDFMSDLRQALRSGTLAGRASVLARRYTRGSQGQDLGREA